MGSRAVTGNRAATTSRSRSAHAALTTEAGCGVWVLAVDALCVSFYLSVCLSV